ncbi:MAG: fuculose phosphate aldolase [Methanolinea sp. SDB]|nr:MAG: fuculose phosphate aldolase [Methanolinea sp. SDB]
MRDTEFMRIGARLFTEGLVGGNFGNISVRAEGGFYITRNGSYLDDPGNPVFVPLEGPVPPEASSEYRVHRQVYRSTRHNALIHAHPPYTVAASLVYDEIVPVDIEGQTFCPIIPVVDGKPGSEEIARNVANALCLSLVTVVKGHGTFASGKSLDEAFILTSLVEHSSHVLWLVGDLQGDTE